MNYAGNTCSVYPSAAYFGNIQYPPSLSSVSSEDL